MAQQIVELQAEVRSGTGKGAARQARREGYVPGIVYGDGKEPVALNMNFHYLLKRLKAGRFLQTLFTLKVEGQDDVQVICRGVQRDVVKDLPTHIDFLRVNANTAIELFIPVEFVNAEAAPGITRGGSLAVSKNELHLNVLAGNIPDQITVDLTGKAVGDVITIADVVLPEGVTSAVANVYEVAHIAAPSGLAAAE